MFYAQVNLMFFVGVAQPSSSAVFYQVAFPHDTFICSDVAIW